MTILCLSPHTDDCELSAGATMAKLSRAGHRVVNVAFSDCDNVDLQSEFKLSSAIVATDCQILSFKRRHFPDQRQQLLDELIRLKESLLPDIIFAPSSLQRHQDHQVIHEEAIRAFSCSIYGYEQPWNSTKQNLVAYMEVEPGHLTSKLTAVDQYTSQLHRPYFTPDFITSWARVRGVQFGVPLAEAFEAIKVSLPL